MRPKFFRIRHIGTVRAAVAAARRKLRKAPTSILTPDHYRMKLVIATLLFHVQCRIPHAKDELLAYIDDFIRDSTEAELRGYREAVTRAFR